MRKREVIKNCIHVCPFYHRSMDGMECSHPYFYDKAPYENMIITQENGTNLIPLKCPLLKEELTITYSIKGINYDTSCG